MNGTPIVLDRRPTEREVASLKKLYDDFTDPNQFIPGGLRIQDETGKLGPFTLRPAQARFLERVKARKALSLPCRFIIDKTRRVGISSVIAGLIFQETAFREGQSALILAHEKAASKNLFGYYDRFERHYKPFLGIGLPPVKNRTDSADHGSLEWMNRSKIEISTAKNLDFGRSFGFRFLHLSEYAFYPSIRGLMTALVAVVPDDLDTMVFKESTANGHNDFYTDCIAAMEGKGDYEFFFSGCFEDPRNWRDLGNLDPSKFVASLTDDEWTLIERYSLVIEQVYWRRKKIEEFNGDDKIFNQEYPHSWEVSFQASGRQRFSPQHFVWMNSDLPAERGEVHKEIQGRQEFYVFNAHQFGDLTVWHHFRKGGQYIAGVDVAKGVDVNEGVGRSDPDYDAVCIGERQTREQVMELHTRLEPTPFAQYLYDLGRWCFQETGCWIYYVIEVEFSGGNGRAVIVELTRLGYPIEFIFHHLELDGKGVARKRTPGFQIRPHTRPLLIANHDRYLIQRSLILHSKGTIGEHNTFVRHANGKIEHEKNCHDDRVFGAMYLTWGFEHAPDLRQLIKSAVPERPTRYGQQARPTNRQEQQRVFEQRMIATNAQRLRRQNEE